MEQYNKTRNSQPVPTQNQNGNVLPFLYTHSSPYSVPLSVIKKNETLTSPEMDMSETASNSSHHTYHPSLLQTIQNDSKPIASIDYYGPTTSKGIVPCIYYFYFRRLLARPSYVIIETAPIFFW